MAEKTAPIITHVDRKEAEAWSPKVSAVVIGYKVETDSGPMILQITAHAAHQLRAVLASLPPDIDRASEFGKRPDR
jgi:hypothetical protein